jgi:hypothetical protein
LEKIRADVIWGENMKRQREKGENIKKGRKGKKKEERGKKKEERGKKKEERGKKKEERGKKMIKGEVKG